MGQAKLHKPVFLPELKGARLFPDECRGGAGARGGEKEGGYLRRPRTLWSHSQGRGRMRRHSQRQRREEVWSQVSHVDSHARHTRTPKHLGADSVTQGCKHVGRHAGVHRRLHRYIH